MQPKDEVLCVEESKEQNKVLEVRKHFTVKDEILLHAKRPLVSKSDRSARLNYSGRVKQSSWKNAQLEFKFRSDNKIRMVC
jgi:hypothetical protein